MRSEPIHPSETSLDVVITSVKRVKNSANGNPRWELFTESSGSFLTAPDAMLGHEIADWKVREWSGRLVTLHLSGKGVFDVTVSKSE